MKTVDRLKNKVPVGGHMDKNDDAILRHGRARHEGFKVGKFVQSVPMFFTQDHHSLHICDMYRGRSAFLVCSGPSLNTLDLSKLKQPGILSLGVNNSIKVHRSQLWCSVDTPSSFMKSIWLDTLITKFVPICHANKKIFDNDAWKFLDMTVGDCPNVVFFRRNEHFKAKQFLTESSINWGCHKKWGGGRSVMIAAIRILYLLGIRKVYIIGCDAKMTETNKYAFEQSRSESSIKGNNNTYQKLNQYFNELLPYFERENFQVFNCYEQSGLRSFPFVEYDTAIRRMVAEMGNIDYTNENTAHLYSTKEQDKILGKKL